MTELYTRTSFYPNSIEHSKSHSSGIHLAKCSRHTFKGFWFRRYIFPIHNTSSQELSHNHTRCSWPRSVISSITHSFINATLSILPPCISQAFPQSPGFRTHHHCHINHAGKVKQQVRVWICSRLKLLRKKESHSCKSGINEHSTGHCEHLQNYP